MAGFRELQTWLKSRLFPGQADGNRRPDGGTSCYRPIQRKNPEEKQAPAASADGTRAAQNIPVAHSGFTDMNPPATGMIGSQSALSGDPYGYGAAQAAQQEYRASYAASREAPGGGNISYMPGAFTPGSGNSYTHVEHIMAVTSLSACYEAIECMKNGESVIATMDTIANESESIRCQDMLAGAAFTLGCTVRMLQAGEVVLIASAGVKVLPEQQSHSWSMPDHTPARPAPVQEEQPRSRRMSQNAVGWSNAFSEENRGYNPYTGSMPAAAGDYGSYGGYGSSGGRESTGYTGAAANGTYGVRGGYAAAGYMDPGYQGGYAPTGYMDPGYQGGYAPAGYMDQGYAQGGYAGGYNENSYGGNAGGYNGTGYGSNTGYTPGYGAQNAGYGY